jgi:hypothetical protein
MRVGLSDRIFVPHKLMPKSWEPYSLVGTVTWILFRLWALLFYVYFDITEFWLITSIKRQCFNEVHFFNGLHLFLIFWKYILWVSNLWTLYSWPRISCQRVNFINLTDDRVHNGFYCYPVGFLVKARAEHRSDRRITFCFSVTLIPCSCLTLTSSAVHLHRADVTKRVP